MGSIFLLEVTVRVFCWDLLQIVLVMVFLFLPKGAIPRESVEQALHYPVIPSGPVLRQQHQDVDTLLGCKFHLKFLECTVSAVV